MKFILKIQSEDSLDPNKAQDQIISELENLLRILNNSKVNNRAVVGEFNVNSISTIEVYPNVRCKGTYVGLTSCCANCGYANASCRCGL